MRFINKHLYFVPAVVLAVAVMSRAQSVTTSTSGFAGDSGGAGNSGADPNSINVSYSADDPTSNVVWTESSSASATASGSSGKLHLFAQAQSQIAPNIFVYVDDQHVPHFSDSPLTAAANCSSSGSIIDTITITSSTLADGTPVDLAVSTSLDCSISCASYGDAKASASLQFYKSGYQYLDDSGYSDFGYIYKQIDNGQTSVDMEQTSNTLHTFVGDSFTVELDASVSATADADWTRPSGTTTADAGNSAFFALDPMTAGADYSTGSGLTYSSVPEPGSVVLIGVGALRLMQRRRRSR